jgi:hypothetical protein
LNHLPKQSPLVYERPCLILVDNFRNPHDALFKWTFSQPELAAAELRAVLPPSLVDRLDLDRLALAEGSFIDRDLQGSQADRLFSVPCDGQLAFVYVLFEHQSTVDPLMPLRLLAYMVRIWQRHVAERGGTALPLPIIIPVVLHHSDTGWIRATEFHSLLDPALIELPEVARLSPGFDFLLDDLTRLSDEQLRRRALGDLASLVDDHFRATLQILRNSCCLVTIRQLNVSASTRSREPLLHGDAPVRRAPLLSPALPGG